MKTQKQKKYFIHFLLLLLSIYPLPLPPSLLFLHFPPTFSRMHVCVFVVDAFVVVAIIKSPIFFPFTFFFYMYINIYISTSCTTIMLYCPFFDRHNIIVYFLFFFTFFLLFFFFFFLMRIGTNSELYVRFSLFFLLFFYIIL